MDIDYFKNYNDTYGHLAGDEVLRKMAVILKRETKGSDIVARYGGEEFAIVFTDTAHSNARLVCERLHQAIGDHIFPGEQTQPNGNLTVSIGLASYPEDGDEPLKILEKADNRLYDAKKRGRDQVVAS
jgi:diguanylate cyclase (GGDEF)-like protein